MIGDEAGNTDFGPDPSEKALSEGEARAYFRFYLLYDKIHREDILNHAYELVKANKGAPGVDGQTFEQIELRGPPEWLEGIRKDLHDTTYQPQPVRRVLIPKPGGGERPLEHPDGGFIMHLLQSPSGYRGNPA